MKEILVACWLEVRTAFTDPVFLYGGACTFVGGLIHHIPAFVVSMVWVFGWYYIKK